MLTSNILRNIHTHSCWPVFSYNSDQTIAQLYFFCCFAGNQLIKFTQSCRKAFSCLQCQIPVSTPLFMVSRTSICNRLDYYSTIRIRENVQNCKNVKISSIILFTMAEVLILLLTKQ